MEPNSSVLPLPLLQLLLLLLVALLVPRTDALSFDPELTRRSAFATTAAAATGWLVRSGSDTPARAAAAAAEIGDTDSLPAAVYRVVPDATPTRNPRLESVAEDQLIDALSKKSGALWLGEHHNAERDHLLQTDIIRKLHASKKANSNSNVPGESSQLAIGLEQVQVQFQPVLDAYISGSMSIEEMRKNVEWDRRWTWPFEGYKGIFETARELKIPLVALNVDSEDLSKVENGGFSKLSPEERQKYILDPQGFAAFAKPGSFKCYVEYVILPSFDMHKRMGLLQYTMSGEKLEEAMDFKKFFSGRILWDEAMASGAYRWTKDNPNGLLIGLVGADHVKYRAGIPGRYDRLVGGTRDCVSVMLNPSLIDTRPSGTVSMEENTRDPNQLTLQLIYAKDGVDATTDARFLDENIGGSFPLADYIVTSRS
eukprot:jgi/Psemu1/284311/fgenesh1_pg.49_\